MKTWHREPTSPWARRGGSTDQSCHRLLSAVASSMERQSFSSIFFFLPKTKFNTPALVTHLWALWFESEESYLRSVNRWNYAAPELLLHGSGADRYNADARSSLCLLYSRCRCYSIPFLWAKQTTWESTISSTQKLQCTNRGSALSQLLFIIHNFGATDKLTLRPLEIRAPSDSVAIVAEQSVDGSDLQTRLAGGSPGR